MATIRKRGHRYQVQVQRLGVGAVSKSFHVLKDAEAWARQTEIREKPLRSVFKPWAKQTPAVNPATSGNAIARDIQNMASLLQTDGDSFISI